MPPFAVNAPVKVVVPVTAKVPPSEVAPLPTVRVAVPAMLVLPLKLVVPATLSVPPRLVAPVPTFKVLEPLMLVAPFKVTPPVPVENVVAPVWLMLPLKVAPTAVRLPLPSILATRTLELFLKLIISCPLAPWITAATVELRA